MQRRAVAHLPSVAPELAEEALAVGFLERAAKATAWEGSLGRVHGVHVVLVVSPDLHARLTRSPSTLDVLTRAVAAAISESPGQVLADLALEASDEPGPPEEGSGPYRRAR